MILQGVLINCLAIGVGSALGLMISHRLSPKLQQVIEFSLGISTVIIGIQMSLKLQNVLLVIGCLALGGVIGHCINLQGRLDRLTQKLQNTFQGSLNSRFSEGLSISSILFCTGAMAIVGSINSGTSLNHDVLTAKALLDGTISMSFAAVYGFGVAFSMIPVGIYQGAIALGASKLSILSHPSVLADISGVGGILVFMIGLSLSKIKEIRIVDYLPAILLILIFGPLLTFFK